MAKEKQGALIKMLQGESGELTLRDGTPIVQEERRGRIRLGYIQEVQKGCHTIKVTSGGHVKRRRDNYYGAKESIDANAFVIAGGFNEGDTFAFQLYEISEDKYLQQDIEIEKRIKKILQKKENHISKYSKSEKEKRACSKFFNGLNNKEEFLISQYDGDNLHYSKNKVKLASDNKMGCSAGEAIYRAVFGV